MKITVKKVGSLDENYNIMVVEAKLILVECEASESIFAISTLGENTIYLGHGNLLRTPCKYYKPVLISEEEICETGELYLSSIKRDIKPKREGVVQAGDKILALPEHFDSTTIEFIRKRIVKDGETILLECEGDHLPNEKCVSTGVCQETEGFKGTEHEGVDVCEDGCVQGKAERWVKLDKHGHIHFFHPIEPVSDSGKLLESLNIRCTQFINVLNERMHLAHSVKTYSAYVIVKDQFLNLFRNFYTPSESLRENPEPKNSGVAGDLKDFYNWYSEANTATRGQVLNELQRRLGLPIEKYPSPEYRYSEAFVLWYSGMKPEQIHAAYRRYNREAADKMQRDLAQGILELKTKPKPKPGELEL